MLLFRSFVPFVRPELTDGRVSIEELIAHLDAKKDEAIERTFKTIAKHFSEVFAELVPGGKAMLVMETGKVRRHTQAKDRKKTQTENTDVDSRFGVAWRGVSLPLSCVSLFRIAPAGRPGGHARRRWRRG